MSDPHLDNLIVGHRGQDGTLLRQQLEQDGATWIGLSCGAVESSLPGTYSPVDLADVNAVLKLIERTRPKRVFYLAAAHESSTQADARPLHTRYARELNTNALGVLNTLEAIRAVSPETRLVFASSSFIFAPTDDASIRLDETSPRRPSNTYAMQKLLAGEFCRAFREEHGLHASVAILFNHESPYRRPGFFASHVMSSIAAIVHGEADTLEVGGLDAVVDWSYAGDAVRAMRLIANHDAPDEYVVSSGRGHTVRQFLERACQRAGLDIDRHVKVNPDRLHRRNPCRVGDASKLINATGWEPTMSFTQLVEHLVDHALQATTRN